MNILKNLKSKLLPGSLFSCVFNFKLTKSEGFIHCFNFINIYSRCVNNLDNDYN